MLRNQSSGSVRRPIDKTRGQHRKGNAEQAHHTPKGESDGEQPNGGRAGILPQHKEPTDL